MNNNLDIKNEKELDVATRAINQYRSQVKSIQDDIDFLKTMKFPAGTIVVKKGTSYMDSVFSAGDGNIGIITGYDHKYKWYRVYYNPSNSYIGVKEEQLELFTGETPSHLLNHDFFNINTIVVNLKDKKEN